MSLPFENCLSKRKLLFPMSHSPSLGGPYKITHRHWRPVSLTWDSLKFILYSKFFAALVKAHYWNCIADYFSLKNPVSFSSLHKCWSQKYFLIDLPHANFYFRFWFLGNPICDRVRVWSHRNSGSDLNPLI